MRFHVLSRGTWPIPTKRRNVAYLVPDSWDDWFTYETRNSLYYVDRSGDVIDIGTVKIAQFGMGKQRSATLPGSFTTLEGVFSLGQDSSYYEMLSALPSDARESILTTLGDIVYDEALYERALEEDVTGTSLMRYVSASTIEQQFRRILIGGDRLERYVFSFKYPEVARAKGTAPSLRFEVTPGSAPPSNVHAIIGRNGVGKTFLLENLAKCLVPELAEGNESPLGEVRVHSGSLKFAGVTSVTFSAFDAFEPLSQPRNRTTGPNYTYIGLKALRKGDPKSATVKGPAALAREFGASMRACLLGERIGLWRAALQTLASDPIFNQAGIDELAREDDLDLVPDAAKNLFKRLSSGHKIVLLTMTRLVEVVEERSLILLDEPEAHLHPPLLSAFVRALSDLLQERNGVAIVTTHSPVVLQEVPSRCAWIVNRQGRIVDAHRPETETFGENVGVLTHAVFGLEVTQSGFYDLIQKEVERLNDYAELLDHFGGQLGSEASAMARAMFINKRRRSDRGA